MTETTIRPNAMRPAHANGRSRLAPRHERVIRALLTGDWIIREELDRVAGSSNGPDVIYQLRCRFGYDAIESERIDSIDRDGKPCQIGRYRLTQQGQEQLAKIGMEAHP